MSALRGFRSGRLRRVRSIATLTVLVVAGLLWIGSAQAVHNTGMFELDGNVVHNAATTPPYDWTSLFGASGNQLITPDPVNGPVLASVFVNDTDAIDTTYFAGGTKIDDQVHNMACGGPAANDKTSMDFVYAANIHIPLTAPDNAGHDVLYLGLEKQAAGNGGDNAFGFWLFKNNNVGCSGSGSFTGAHTDGDLFIDGLFTNGGGASDVEVFRWNGNDTSGSLGTTPVATGNVCGVVTNDQQCAIANNATITAGPWRAPATTMAANTFVEAGIDLTALLGDQGGCFSTFLADSQASQSTDSQPKDYAGGTLTTCVTPPIVTNATPGGQSVPLGDTTQHDVATLSAAGGHPSPTGAMTFFLCNPSQVTGAGCPTGGTQVGNAITISAGSATSANASGTLLNAPGTYCWRAVYAPDADGSKFYSAGSETNALTSGAGAECFVVVKNTTGIVTAATSATIGAAIHDVATLSGATATAGGTITFNLYGPSDTPDCSGSVVFTKTVSVSGNGNYSSGDFTPSTAGKYYWIASYSGDANNKPVTGTCGDSGETSTIDKKTTGIATAATSATVGAAIHDVATLSGATANAGGTITFNLYGPSDTPDCSGSVVFTATVNVSGPGDYNSGDFTPSTAGKYYWIASYSGDVNNLPATGSCGDQGETSTIGKQTTGLVTAATSGTIGDAVHDIATLSGGLNPTGTITFNLYGPSASPDCSGNPVYTNTVTVNGNGDYNSGDFTPTTAGSYYWTASYSGDANNLPSSEACGSQGETSTLIKRTTGIVTAATDASIGNAIHDVATLSGATADAGGTITFNLYGPSDTPDCSGSVVFTATVNVSGNGNYSSGDFTPSTAGKYYWIASYSGDGNNLPSSGTCGDSGETSTVGKQPTSINTSATSGTLGDAIHDIATLSGATANAGGTITFNLYGPSSSPDCSGSAVYTNTVNVNGPGNYNSGNFTPTAAGKYYWIASYSGDVNNQPSTGTCGDEGETSTLQKRPTAIVTSATSGTIGDAVHDIATLSGASADAGGTITFNLYGPSDTPDCSGSVVFTATVNVSGNGNYDSGNFTPTTAGKYYWIASYSGDGNNLPSTGACGDEGETTTIAKQPTSIGTAATSGTIGDAVHDIATLSGGHSPTGTITFNLYGPSDTPDCSGVPVFTKTVDVNGNGDYSSGDFTPDTAGKYYWVASYSGDVNNLPSTGACGDEGETTTIGKKSPTIGTAATSGTIGDAVHDIATLSGTTPNAGGTITFKAWGPSDTPDCSGDPVFTSTVNVDGPGNYNSGDFTPDTAGKYYWTASYSGDANNDPVSGSCGDEGETSTIGKQPTSISTAATSGTIGDAIHDVATLSGATAHAGGTITFNLYGPSDTPDCSGDAVFTKTVDVSGPGDYGSGDFTPDTAGKYYWVASYSGDVNNQASSGSCGDDGETSTIAKQPTSISTDATSGSKGDAIHDVATLSGGHNPTGEITFSLYGPSDTPDCSGEPVFTDTVGVDGNGDYQSADFTPDTAGTYYWVASYSGDVNNEPSTGTCGDEGETSTIKPAEIKIVKTADAAKVNVGSPIGFTMTVYNAGDGDAHDVTLTDKLPTNPGLSWTIASQGTGWGENGCSIDSGTLTCGPVLVPGGTTQAESTFTVHITSTTAAAAGGDCPGSGTVNNTGDVTTSNDGSDESTASTCVQALVDLAITKAGSPATQVLGSGNITWTIVVTNHGPDADTGVTITDPMPAGNTFVSATTSQGSCTGGAILTCNLGNMAAGATATITLVTKPSTAGAQTNTVTVSGNRPETNTGNNQASATVQVTPQVFPPPVVYCVAVSRVTPKQLFVGRKTTLTIHVTQHGKAKAGVRVQIKAPKLSIRTKPSNAKGVIKQNVKMKKAGAMIFSPIASKRCNTKRIGITNVFTPPVTG